MDSRARAKLETKCYPRLGCFPMGKDFASHDRIPETPEMIKVKMLLHTRETGSENNETLDWQNPKTIADSTFDSAKPTFIFVHGFLSSVDEEWLVDLVKVSLLMADVNTVRIGWTGGASLWFPWSSNPLSLYAQWTANTRVVGAEIAMLVTEMKKLGANLDSFWLIGHSLGAHVMGFAGKRVPGIGRITGLDPADPRFGASPPAARLDPSDATFVDVIHTDGHEFLEHINGGFGFGVKKPLGHVDYYPNGGENQPGCKQLRDVFWPSNIKENTVSYVTCNHQRAYKILIEAIKAKAEGRTCRFKAHQCDSYESYLTEECQSCGQGCTIIGPDALKTKPKTKETLVKTYLVTLGKAPYCGEEMLDITVEVSSGLSWFRNPYQGQIFVKILFGGKVVKQEVTTSNHQTLKPGHNLHRLMVVRKGEINPDRIKKMEILFDRYSLKNPSTWKPVPKWFKAEIKVSVSLAPLDDERPVDERQRRRFCAKGQKTFALMDDYWKTIKRCN